MNGDHRSLFPGRGASVRFAGLAGLSHAVDMWRLGYGCPGRAPRTGALRLLALLALLMLTARPSNGRAEVSAPRSAERGTLHLWKFDENQPDRAVDAVSGRAAVFNGECRRTEGRFGKGVHLDGETGWIGLGFETNLLFGPTNSFTAEAWVKVFREGQTQRILSSSPHYEMEVRGESGAVSFNLMALGGAAPSVRCTGATDITDGKWHHVVTVRDTARQRLVLLIDGRVDAEEPDATYGRQVCIGAQVAAGGGPVTSEKLAGVLDEIRISKGVRLPQPEVRGAVAGGAEEHVLENDHVRVVFRTQGGRVTLGSLVDRLSGIDFIETRLSAAAVPNLWQISARTGAGAVILDEEQVPVTVHAEEMPDGRRLRFLWNDLAVDGLAEPAKVVMSVELANADPGPRWFIEVGSAGRELGVWTVRFPRVANIRKLAQDGTREYVAIPGGNGGGAGEGQLYRDPFRTLDPRVRTYPCYHQSMQFNAYYGPTGGLYLAALDGASHLKGFLVRPADDPVPAMSFEVLHYPADAGVPGTGFRQPYPVVIRPFTGDWYDAARIYRQWALRQTWCRLGPLTQRQDISPWIRGGAYWVLFPFELEKDQRQHLRKLARTMPIDLVQQMARHIDVERSLAAVRAARDYFGFPMILWCSSWFEGGGDTSPPRYIPCNNVDTFLEALHAELPDVTFSAHIQPKRFSTQVLEYDDDVLASLERTPSGQPAIGPVMPGETYDQHAYPCWYTPLWKDFWAAKSFACASLGMDGFHIDELGSATSFDSQCFSRAHGHPAGGGTLYAETRRAMVETIRTNARRARPGFAAHHEVLCEIYIDVADLAEVCTSPSNINVPMYEAVYHDYSFVMGRRIIKWTDRNLWPAGGEPGDEKIDEFVASFGETFVWGNQPGWTRIDVPSYAPQVAAIIKRFMAARYRAMKFLNVGDMMRPLEVTEPLPEVRTIWRACDTPEHVQPAILNSVWRAADGTVGIVLVNISDRPQTIRYRCDLAACGFETGPVVLTRIDGETPQGLGRAEGLVLERSDQLEDRSVMIIEISASDRPGG